MVNQAHSVDVHALTMRNKMALPLWNTNFIQDADQYIFILLL